MKRVICFCICILIFNACGTVSESVKEDLRAQGFPVVITRIVKDGPDFVGGVGVRIFWQNISDKEIKYVVFILVPYNRVNDQVRCTITGDFSKRLLSTGPFKPNKISINMWEAPWYNSSIDHFEIVGLEVTYMDNSIQKFDSEVAPKMFIK